MRWDRRIIICALLALSLSLLGQAVNAQENNDRANQEALLNIAANGMEIWGLGAVANFFFGGIAALAKKGWIVGAILLFLIPVVGILGFGTPGLINWLVTDRMKDQSSRFILIVIMYVLMTSLVFGFGFLPTMISFARQHSKKWLIFGLTFISWIVPMGWPALLLFAYWDTETNVDRAPA